MIGVAGAVLAGGRGERLGRRPKALLPLGPSGEPLMALTVALLREVADPVLVSSADPAADGFGCRVVVDRFPGTGPLGAIASVLAASPRERVLVVACDMPTLSRPLLERLVALAHENPAAVAVVPRTERGLHPLHAVYSRALLPALEARLAQGRYAVHEALAGALEVGEAELRRFDPELASLANVNTPDDLARVVGADRARAVLRALRPTV